MKSVYSCLALISVLSLPSCVVPSDYSGPGYASSSVGYSTYDSLPPGFAGDSYYYSGRYYAGGLYERGRFNYGGRSYGDRYLHNGRYYYGGRHESHDGGAGHPRRAGDRLPVSQPDWTGPRHAGRVRP